jgi:hypothetical protein
VTPSEFAFLALGLVLGIATGAAIVVVVRSHPPTREVRLTVAHDAVPRRGSTLATDAFSTDGGAPASGGPGDRRATDRTAPGVPVERTPVREPAPLAAIPIHPEPDGLLARIRQSGRADGSLLPHLLDGDHRAMTDLLDGLAGTDPDRRAAWDELLSGLVEAIRGRAIDLGFIDLPMGKPFWDAFTIDQCRQITAALASMGRRFDGHDGWADGVVPDYRDLSQAMADVGLDPVRIRVWPNQLEIGELYRGAHVAGAELVDRFAPTLEAADMQAFLGARARGLSDLWLAWDAVRVALGAGAAAIRE